VGELYRSSTVPVLGEQEAVPFRHISDGAGLLLHLCRFRRRERVLFRGVHRIRQAHIDATVRLAVPLVYKRLAGVLLLNEGDLDVFLCVAIPLSELAGERPLSRPHSEELAYADFLIAWHL